VVVDDAVVITSSITSSKHARDSLLLFLWQIAQLLPHAHLLSRVHTKLERGGRLKDEHDRAPETKSSHLLARV
jgi:hypothetical protein